MGTGYCSGLQVDVVLVVRVVQHGVERDFVDLGDGRDVAGHARIGFDVLLALQQEQVADLERLAAVADEELRSRRDRALVARGTRASLPTNGSTTTLKTCASTCLFGSGSARISAARPRPSPL